MIIKREELEEVAKLLGEEKRDGTCRVITIGGCNHHHHVDSGDDYDDDDHDSYCAMMTMTIFQMML